MAETFFQLIQPSVWTQITDVVEGSYVHIEGAFPL
jgi:hypothetical protein